MSDDALADALAKIMEARWDGSRWDRVSDALKAEWLGEAVAAAIRGGALEAHGVLVVEEIKDGVMRAPLYRRVGEGRSTSCDICEAQRRTGKDSVGLDDMPNGLTFANPCDKHRQMLNDGFDRVNEGLAERVGEGDKQ